MRESRIEKHLKQVVKSYGGECLKWVSPGRHGVNDQLAFLPDGQFYMFECKRPGYSLDPHQERFRLRMKELGFTVIKCDSIEFIDDFFSYRYRK